MKAVLTGLGMALLLASHAGAGAIFVYNGTLTGAAESPPNASPATGSTTITYDSVAHTLRVEASFSGLTSTDTGAHIHCCTTVAGTGTATVATPTPAFPGFPLGVTSGTHDGTLDLTLGSSWNPSFVTASGGTPALAEAALGAGLAAGTAYLNIHTTTFPGGEIRAFPVLVPVELVGFTAE